MFIYVGAFSKNRGGFKTPLRCQSAPKCFKAPLTRLFNFQIVNLALISSSCRSGPALSSGGPPKTGAPSIWVETSARPSRVLTNLTQ